MQTYRAPLADFAFLLRDVFDHDGAVATLPRYTDAPLETVLAVLEEAAAFCEEVLLPLNRTGDAEGLHLRGRGGAHAGGLPRRLRRVRRRRVERDRRAPEYGGTGLPAVVQAAFEEMVCSANLSFCDLSAPDAGAAAALVAHASRIRSTAICPGSRAASGRARCA